MKKNMKKIKLTRKSVLLGVLFFCVVIVFYIAYWHNRAKEDGYYYIDIDGNIVSGRYGFATSFENGVALCADDKEDKERNYLNTDFEIIGDRKYDFDSILSGVYNGEAIFTAFGDNSIDILDKDMKKILSVPYNAEGCEYIRFCSGAVGANGLFPIRDNTSGKWGYMDISGNMVIEPKFDKAEPFNEDNVAVVYDSGLELYGVIDSDGNYKIEPAFNEIKLYGNNVALVMNEKEDKQEAYFVDVSGKKLSDERYDIDAGIEKHAVDGCIPVKNLQGNYGYISLDMSPLTEFKYKRCLDFSNGMAIVVDQNDLCGYIDTTGKEVVPCQYESADNFGEYDLATVESNGKCGLIRKDGSFYTKPIYDEIWPFSSGYSVVYLHKGQKVKICK